VAQALRREGYEVFWDREGTAVGGRWQEQIEQALDAAAVVLVFWSQAAVRSEWVQAEAAEAARRGVMLPVLLDDASPPLAFRQYHAVALPVSRGDLTALLRLTGEFAARRPGDAYAPSGVPAGSAAAANAPAPPRRWRTLALIVLVMVLGGTLVWALLTLWTRPVVGDALTPPASAPVGGVPAPYPAARTLAVPDVQGLSAADARARLERDGLAFGTIPVGGKDEVPDLAGVVTQQLPVPGTVVVAGTRVKLSVETRTTRMPDVRGLGPDLASKQLVGQGLRVNVVRDPDAPPRQAVVLQQSAEPGRLMAVGDLVTLTVAARAPAKK
jgi:TIR domain/PASTA domain